MAKLKAFDCVIRAADGSEYILTVGASDEKEARRAAREHTAERYGEDGKVGAVKKA